MRRISLALALMGAVAAAGCGGAGTSPASSGGNKGVEQASFKLVVRGENAYWDATVSTTIILPRGGVVSGGGIDCGVDAGGVLHKTCEALIPYSTAAMSLTATPAAPYTVYGWAGACGGTGACSFAMTDTRFVGIRFATTTANLGAHPGFTDPAIHGQEFFKVVDVDGVFLTTTAPAAAYMCTRLPRRRGPPRGRPGAVLCLVPHVAGQQGRPLRRERRDEGPRGGRLRPLPQ